MLYVCVRGVMDVMFSVLLSRVELYGKYKCFVMQLLYLCVLCASSMLHSLQMLVEDARGDHMEKAPNDTVYKRCCCHSGYKLLCKLCRNLPPPAMGARFTVFRQSDHADPPCSNHTYTKSTPKHIHHSHTQYTSSLKLHPPTQHIVTPGFVNRPLRSDCTAGQIDGEAYWWTTIWKIELPPLARVMGVDRHQQQHLHTHWGNISQAMLHQSGAPTLVTRAIGR